MDNNLPLDTRSYPADLQREVESAVEAVLSEEPLPAGAEEKPLFKAPGRPRRLPVLGTQILGLSGKPRSGKDVLAEYLTANYQGVARLNFSDPIIEEVNRWLAVHGRRITASNKSHPVHRRLLQVWGRARREEQEDYWTERLRERISEEQTTHRLVIVCGVRAPSDLALIEEMGGVCVRVTRPGNTYQAEDPIESALDNYQEQMISLENPQEGELGPYVENIERLISSGLTEAATC